VKTFVYAVPDGIPEGGQILLTVYEDAELRGDDLERGDWKPEDRYEIATREPAGWGIRVWSPPLELEAKS
jgi:hypothetical protein